jgi:hypothetical protein
MNAIAPSSYGVALTRIHLLRIGEKLTFLVSLFSSIALVIDSKKIDFPEIRSEIKDDVPQYFYAREARKFQIDIVYELHPPVAIDHDDCLANAVEDDVQFRRIGGASNLRECVVKQGFTQGSKIKRRFC